MIKIKVILETKPIRLHQFLNETKNKKTKRLKINLSFDLSTYEFSLDEILFVFTIYRNDKSSNKKTYSVLSNTTNGL